MHPVHLRPTTILTAALIVLAGLACDENAPTETRAPASTVDATDAEADQAALTGDGVTAQAIALPVNQSISTTNPNPAFRINQTGSGPNGYFQISNSSNAQSAFQAQTNGRGRAGHFRITSSANPQSAIEAQTAGTGRAGLFRITNAADPQPALEAQTNGTGFAVQGIGTGPAAGGAYFEANGANFFPPPAGPALRAVSKGSQPPAADIAILNATNSNSALHVITQGTGSAAFFASAVNVTPADAKSTVLSHQLGSTQAAGRFRIINANSTSNALEAVGDHQGRAFSALQTGSGEAGRFETSNAANGNSALSVKTVGTGLALEVEQGNSAFFGNVAVFGVLTKAAGSFTIDHPLDPEHKTLSHSFVESPDMMNVYNGNVELDSNGRATVELPAYFQALNRDFRYQLTAIGAPGPNLYIAEGVKGNRFRIAGGRPYARVSWQVTGIRKDAYAEEHRIKVEEEKPRAEPQLAVER